jgi:hypothetical protein
MTDDTNRPSPGVVPIDSVVLDRIRILEHKVRELRDELSEIRKLIRGKP